MYCNQCEQTAGGVACTRAGVCGKDAVTSDLQDELLQNLIKLAKTQRTPEKDKAIIQGLFSTITNVNFDPVVLKGLIEEAAGMRGKPEQWKTGDDNVVSLKQIVLYGLKGMAAYADHAMILGKTDDSVTSFFYKALSGISRADISKEELLALSMELGKTNLRCMELLDSAHTESFGHPTLTKVSTGARKGPAILVSGHDLLDLHELLVQTEGKGISIYTHGEMLPAHGYPGLKKFSHLAGNYGGAWQDQVREFAQFPGAILMTTNCIQRPADSYRGRIFTSGLVSYPGVMHVERKDFSDVIAAAIVAGGFKEDEEGKDILVGFGHDAAAKAAPKVLELVKAGKIKRFYLIGGCDGAKPGRNYYTQLAESLPKDTVILTLACGKYRFNKLDFGDIDGIPRLLDVGQCNDSYSAVRIALMLSEATGLGVNDLPLTIVLSWYEQKAVAVLLTLLSLGVKNIRIGPSLPAFVSADVLSILVEMFNLRPIGTVEEELKH